EIGPDFARPNGMNSGDEHWPIRRWKCSFTGTLNIDWRLAKKEMGGNGVTARIFHNGAQLDVATIAGDDLIGTNRTLVITNARTGDLIDLALSPVGVPATSDDTMDGTLMTATIRAFAAVTNEIATDIAATMRGVNATVYARFPFVVANPSEFEFLTLRMKY